MLVSASPLPASQALAAQDIEKDPDAEIARGIAKVKILNLGKAAQIAYDERDIVPAVKHSDAIFEIVENMAAETGSDRAKIFTTHAVELHKVGYFFAAERLFYTAYRINAVELGEHHPYTLSSLNNLASNLNAQGRSAEAAIHYQEVLDFRTLILGSRDPLTINSLANLGYTYGQQGQLTKARELLERALTLNEEVRGRDDVENAKFMILLADVLGNKKFVSESEAYLRVALKILNASNGPYHEDTMSCLHRLGTNLSMQKKYSEAEPYFYHAWTRREIKLGKESEATLRSKEGLIASLKNQGLQQEVAKILGVAEEVIH
jgi:tetratricopeptide (TPR) repeat protein